LLWESRNRALDSKKGKEKSVSELLAKENTTDVKHEMVEPDLLD
jgi:hypothetical protein